MSGDGILESIEKGRQLVSGVWQGVMLVSTPLRWINRNSPRCPECRKLRTKHLESCPRYKVPEPKRESFFTPPMGPFEASYLMIKRDGLKGTVKAFARGVPDFDADELLAHLIEIGKSVDRDDCAAVLSDLTDEGDLVSFESDQSQRWRVRK